ncbi:MAG TPA: PilZ domain-containing protein [Terriglobales bacterium]|nr:PilZ domain-containing protein [Terriglobales bacterium]
MTSKPARVSTASVAQKALARVAIIGLSHAGGAILADCFKQFGIQSVAVAGDEIGRLSREKFDACVVRLDDEAEPVLEAVRTSRSNFRVVIYGVCKTAQEALRFSRYSVNAVVDWPIERQNALKVVRATHLLVLHEFRRYVRVPIVSEVRVKLETGGEVRGSSLEISGGGMSISGGSGVASGQNATVTFALPEMAEVSIRGLVCWTRPADTAFGFRFDNADESRYHVRQWIDDFISRS